MRFFNIIHHTSLIVGMLLELEQHAQALQASWTHLGPAPIRNGQVPNNPFNAADGTPGNNFAPVSGRITGLAADPSNASTIYVAEAGGGVWKTTNGGTSWTPLADTQITLFMGSIALGPGATPSSPLVVWAGTGESNNSGDSYYGRGVLKSTDGGTTWTLLTGNPGNSFDRRTIAKVAPDPLDSSIVYADVANPGANGLANNTGIWKSINGGTTWVNTTSNAGLTSSATYSDLVINPNNRNVLYAAIGTAGGSNANGVYKTTNAGGGWAAAGDFAAKAGANVGRIALAISNVTPDVVYAAVARITDNTANSGILLGIFKTTDGGTTWNALAGMAIPNYMDGQGWYDTTIAIDPANANIIYVGGAGSVDATGSQILKITTNAGNTITSIVDISAVPGQKSGPHADHHGIGFDANNQLLVGTDGGIWRLNNKAENDPTKIEYTNLNGNLETIQFTGVALDPSNPSIAYGGSQDNGTEKFTGTLSWNAIRPGDGGFVRVDPINTSTVYHTFTGISLQRSDDGGATWTNKTTGITAPAGLVDVGGFRIRHLQVGDSLNKIADLTGTAPVNFYPPYVLDRFAPTRVLFGTDRVFESRNRGDTWNALGASLIPGRAIDAVASTSVDSTIYAVAGGDGSNAGAQIFATINHGTTWTAGAIGRHDHFSDVTAEPVEATDAVAYAVSDRFNSLGNIGHVFRTTDRGLNWVDISGNLPDLPTWSIVVDPGLDDLTINDDILYVGTDNGVYFSTNQGGSWARFGGGLPNVQVRQVEFNSDLRVVAAGTHGRGLWEFAPPAAAAAVDGDRRDALPDSKNSRSIAFKSRLQLFDARMLTSTPSVTMPFQVSLAMGSRSGR